jgi:hypothetical protein
VLNTVSTSSGERLPVDGFSDTLPSLRDFGVVMPRRLPAFAIQFLFSVAEPADAGVVGRDCGGGVHFWALEAKVGVI